MNDEDLTRASELFIEGLSFREIAKKIDVSHTTVAYYIKKTMYTDDGDIPLAMQEKIKENKRKSKQKRIKLPYYHVTSDGFLYSGESSKGEFEYHHHMKWLVDPRYLAMRYGNITKEEREFIEESYNKEPEAAVRETIAGLNLDIARVRKSIDDLENFELSDKMSDKEELAGMVGDYVILREGTFDGIEQSGKEIKLVTKHQRQMELRGLLKTLEKMLLDSNKSLFVILEKTGKVIVHDNSQDTVLVESEVLMGISNSDLEDILSKIEESGV